MTTKAQTPVGSETRRHFIKKSAAAAVAVTGANLLPIYGQSRTPEVLIVADSSDATLKQPPVRWALEQLQNALRDRGATSRVIEEINQATPENDIIAVARPSSKLGSQILKSAGKSVPDVPEALGLIRGKAGNRTVLLASGSDVRGVVYALLEIADRVTHGDRPLVTLRQMDQVVEQPANPIRSVARLFTSAEEDKPWFNDRVFWEKYLSMLMAQRFNRFSLTLGLGYNAPRNVRDAYFYFAYPFLVSPPGYDVRGVGLPNDERARNLEMLRWISEAVTTRGLHFQLALWTHAYRFIDSPNANYTITGLTPENHAAYCRDALQMLLQACPAIQGVTFRSHSESGIPEGSYDFWRTLFEGVVRSRRRIEIDIHSKGIEHKLLDMAVGTGLPVNVSPKYWAEHMGLPYHQASIRGLERPKPSTGGRARVEEQRRFTRYGYGDYLREDRAYGVLYRIWPGTQRLLLWGDPVFAAGYGRYAHFCGSLGLELCEPLSFKGRMGSGSVGGHDPFADASFRAPGGDWEMHLYTYRLWGRLLYNPETPSDSWRRFLKTEFGSAATECEAALARASRVLPLITTAHHPSASNNAYWPEIYTNMPIVSKDGPQPYGDTPSPKRFGTVSSLDPELFSSVEEFVDDLVQGRSHAQYSPLEVARWLNDCAEAAENHLSRAKSLGVSAGHAAFKRLALDVAVQAGTGRFFAEKLRAGVAFALYERSGDRAALDEALKQYRAARETWQKFASLAKGIYRDDLTFGLSRHLRGHWADRLAAIDQDLADMEKLKKDGGSTTPDSTNAQRKLAATASAIIAASTSPPPQRPRCEHVARASVRRGQPLSIELSLEAGRKVAGVRLHYRHANQAEEYQRAEMSFQEGRYKQTIPGEYTNSPYPLVYFFEVWNEKGEAWLYPGLKPDLSNQPYFAVRLA